MSGQRPRFWAVNSALAVFLLVVGCCGVVQAANPNSRDPLLPLEIHNLTNAQPTLETANTLFASLLKELQAIGKNPARVSPKKVSDLHVQLRQLRRAALDLQMLGETAGVDFSLRAGSLGNMLSTIVGAVRATPPGQTYANQARQVLGSPKATQARKAMAQKLQALLDQKKLEEAYNEASAAVDQVTSLTLFLEPREEEIFMQELATVDGHARIARNAAFRQQVRTSLDEQVTAQLPATQDLVQRIAAAATTLRSAPVAPLGEKNASGPDCLKHFGDAWQQLHLSALRCRAMDWARMTSTVNDNPLPQIDPQEARLPNDALTPFYDEVTTALASLIEADAQRAASADAPALYAEYLRILPPLAASTADDKLPRAVQPALEKLAGKSATFADQVKAYQAATHELLRWRERLARSQAAADKSPSSDQVMLKTFKPEGAYRGLFLPADSSPNRAILFDSCPQLLPVAGQRALGQPIQVRDLVGLAGGKLAVARYQNRHYATLPLPDVTAELTRLEQDLLVSVQQPALTLEAAIALDAARRGQYAAAGGLIKGLHLEGLIPRFAALRPEAQQLASLGPLPAEVPPDGFISHVLVRLEVEPTWVQHRYFYVRIPPASPAADK